MKLCGAAAAALGIACRSKIFRSGNAGADDGANAFEQEHQSNRYADCRRADPRIHHADETSNHQQNADGKDPAPAAHAEGVQIKCADEPGDAGEHQPDRKEKRQRQQREPLVKEQEQRHDYSQHAVKQQISTPLIPANTTISVMPAASMKMPSIKPTDSSLVLPAKFVLHHFLQNEHFGQKPFLTYFLLCGEI